MRYNEKFNNGCTGFIKRNKMEWGKNSDCIHIIDEDLNEMLRISKGGIKEIIQQQKSCFEK